MSAEKEISKTAEEYTIKFIPPQGGDVRTIRLPINLLKYGVVSLLAGALLFVGAFSYAVYSTFANRNGAAEIEDLRQVNSIQQEQLLQLAKKANSLQEEMNQLKKLEEDIRRLSGAQPLQENQQENASGEQGVDPATHNGQGGPISTPTVQNVSDTLALVEQGLAQRRESLTALKEELSKRQEQLGLPGGLSLPGGTTPAIWPARGVVSSPYGLRWNGSDFHPGIDIANDMGTPILATADGVVRIAGWNDGGYGNMVDIDHGNGIMTRYGHAMQVAVTAGQHVRRGQVIAYMGSTGFSTGPHVHYEVRINGQAVNPSAYLH
jgi:murein DD-endopeptidase MepM/ murein hydrolase activator NlpD